MLIEMIKDEPVREGKTSRLRKGFRVQITQSELDRRGLPADCYRVVSGGAGPIKPDPKPGEVRTGDVPSPRGKTSKKTKKAAAK